MEKRKTKQEESDPFAEWRAIQLTPEQKAEARAELRKLLDEAAAAGAYERLAGLRGKVKFSLSYEEMAGKDDDLD